MPWHSIHCEIIIFEFIVISISPHSFCLYVCALYAMCTYIICMYVCMYVYVFVYACLFTMCVGIMYHVFVYVHTLCVSVYACIIHVCMRVLCASTYVYMHPLCASVYSCLSEEISLSNVSMAGYCHHAVLLDIQKLPILHNENWLPWSISHFLCDLISPSFYPQKPTIHLAYIILESPTPVSYVWF